MVTKKPIPGQSDIIDNIIASNYPFNNILDIGCGNGQASKKFRDAGKSVTATSYDIEKYIASYREELKGITLHPDIDICDMSVFDTNSFDAIWCAHVLEHIMDTGQALREVRRVLKPNGQFFVSVPPFKHEVVGGHVTPGWNIGILMYNLAVAGFDLSNGTFIKHGYNVFGAVKNGTDIPKESALHFSNGDIETLRDLGRFPRNFPAQQGFDGDLKIWNWKWNISPTLGDTSSRENSEKKSIKIAFFIPWITKGRGGTENVGSMMANAMVKKGHEAVIYTFDNEMGESCWPLNKKITLRCYPETITNEVEGQLLLELAVQKPDLIVGLHMNRNFFVSVYCGARLDVPVIVSEHTEPSLPQSIGTITDAERTTIFSGANKIHLLVENFKETLPNFLQKRISIIPNTVPPANKLADTLASHKNKKTILTVARLVKRKNIKNLIDAFLYSCKYVQNWQLQIVGYGPEKKRLLEYVRRCNHQGDILFVDRVDDAYPLYEKAQIFALPSISEGFPMTMLEAMAHGLPLLGYSSCPGINEQIINGKNGILSSGGEKLGTLGKDLLKLILDDHLRAKMGEEALNYYNQRFYPENIYDKWEKLFLETADEKNSLSSTPSPLHERAKITLNNMINSGISAALNERIDVI